VPAHRPLRWRFPIYALSWPKAEATKASPQARDNLVPTDTNRIACNRTTC
jgi:hypothetical protein